MGGPQFSYRRLNRMTPFGHFLIGGTHASVGIAGVGSASQTQWAYGAGGGVDVRVGNHLAVRAVQADWIRSHYPETLTKDAQNNFRISTGLVVRLP